MKALTIWQPWASLIIAGAKPYEFRGWCPPASIQGQRIAIHAAARRLVLSEVAELLAQLRSKMPWRAVVRPEIAIPLLEKVAAGGFLPLSSVLGTAVLGAPRRGLAVLEEFGGPPDDRPGMPCNWAWPLTDIEPLEPLEPCRGHQGFWNW